MPSGTAWETRYADLKVSKDADQAEFNAFKFGVSNLEAGLTDERIAGAMEDFDVPDIQDVPHWAEADAQYDTGTGAVADEIFRRHDLMGEAYPFEVNGNKIRYLGTASLVYEFCLCVTQAPNLTTGKYVGFPRTFEVLSAILFKCYLGAEAEGIRTGWPPLDDGERPAKLRDLIAKLSEMTGEWHWDPAPGLPDDPGVKLMKDCGVDFVVWKPSPDKRAGQLFILGQCACGEWTGKYDDLNIKAIEQWVRQISDAPPLKGFSIPFHISNPIQLREANMHGGLTFDRARLVMLSERDGSEALIPADIKQACKELIRLVVPSFPMD